MIILLLGPVLCENPILSEIYKLTNIYSEYLDQSTLLNLLLCISACFLLFLGRLTKRLSLGYIISIFVFHYIEKIQYIDLEFFYSPIRSFLEKIRDFLIHTSHSYITVLIVSLAFSLLIVYLIGALRLILGLTATYLFYTTYVDIFVNIHEDYQLYVFYISLVVLFIIIYTLFDKAVNVILIILFSVTGSLLLFVTVERSLNFDWGLNQIIIRIQEDCFRKSLSYTTALYFITTVCGVYVQVFFINSLNHL
jgi:hypothetical protein